jgi:mannose-6-phosphate isomerase-like protein (cupin superfamily)
MRPDRTAEREPFQTAYKPAFEETAPDGSLVGPLVRTGRASAGLVTLPAGRVSHAVRHRTVDEIWHVLDGWGELWRAAGDQVSTVDLAPGTCVTIPVGTAFQFRASDDAELRLFMVTIPPWPGDHEAVSIAGPWQADP